MAEKFGICVASQGNFVHLLGLAKAAKATGRHVDVFLTGGGIYLTQQPDFPELLEVSRVGVCEVSYIANGFRGKPVPGLVDKDFVTQARNAEMVEECDRYIIL